MSKPVEERGRWPMTTSAYAKALIFALVVPVGVVLLLLLLR